MRVRLLGHIAFSPQGAPRLTLRRLDSLGRVKARFERLQSTRRFDRQDRGAQLPLLDTVTVDWLQPGAPRPGVMRMCLKKEIRDALTHVIAESGPGADGQSSTRWGYYLRTSDTKDRVLRVMFFRDSSPVLHARIRYGDRVGALASVTRALRDGGFNIITAVSAPAEQKGRATLEVVLHNESLIGNNTSAIKAALQSRLAESAAAQDLQLEVGYPRHYGRDTDLMAVHATGDAHDSAHQNPTLVSELSNRLDDWHRELVKELDQRRLDAEGAKRLALVHRLSGEFARLTSASGPKTLFISCHHGDPSMAVRIATRAKELGFEVVLGRELVQFNDVSEGLRLKIRSCTHYLGVWSHTGAVAIGSATWPSPWLLWELGVAEACALNWRLLVSERIDPGVWTRLHANTPHVIYSEADFESRLDQVLKALACLVSPTYREV